MHATASDSKKVSFAFIYYILTAPPFVKCILTTIHWMNFNNVAWQAILYYEKKFFLVLLCTCFFTILKLLPHVTCVCEKLSCKDVSFKST